jgi:phage N-6-adenine-methyltransferase
VARPRKYTSNAERQAAYRKRKKRFVHFKSESHEWSTPQVLFDNLDAEFGFTLDVCASSENAKCERYYSKQEDGLKQPWTGVCWCNPPYGRDIGCWVEKAWQCSKEGRATVVCLLPARTDTRWWHEFVCEAKEVRFLKGRLKFGGQENSAPFPSAVVVF